LRQTKEIEKMKLRLSPSGPFSNVVTQSVKDLPVPFGVNGGPFVLIATVEQSFLQLDFVTILAQYLTDAPGAGGTIEARVIRIDPPGGVELTLASNSIPNGLGILGLIGFPPLLAAPTIPNFGPGLYEVRFYANSADASPVTFTQFLTGVLS
jgi:hypothetical protein